MALDLIDTLIDTFGTEIDAETAAINKRPPHLRPIYYRVLLTTRPFGLALCKTFDEKYLCVVLPESPSGQLGLRSGSEILSINSFAQKSEVIKGLNERYPSQRQHQFLWMHQFPKVQYLQDNAVMPITLYLKYDPLQILSENTEQKSDTKNENTEQSDTESEHCKYWALLQDDIYRWAVENKSEDWRALTDCDVFSMPAIQSPDIQQSVIDYYYAKDNRQQLFQQLKGEDTTNLKA